MATVAAAKGKDFKKMSAKFKSLIVYKNNKLAPNVY